MRVIRPRRLSIAARRRALAFAAALLVVGLAAATLASLGSSDSLPATGAFAAVAAIGIGVGSVWLVRVLRPERSRDLGNALAARLEAAFDDTYTLLLAPRLPVRDAGRLDGILVGPAGVRVLTARAWEGRYRVRGRAWEFDARRRGWIRCRTNPSAEAASLGEGVSRWAAEAGLGDLPVRPVVAFPLRRSQLVLEEPADEIVTSDNAPWWANAIGRVQRLDPASAERIVDAVLDASEAETAAVSGARSQATAAR